MGNLDSEGRLPEGKTPACIYRGASPVGRRGGSGYDTSQNSGSDVRVLVGARSFIVAVRAAVDIFAATVCAE